MEVSFSNSFKKVFKKRIKSTNNEIEFWIREKPKQAVFVDIGTHDEVY
jgi:mRNA-degrading endonuclease YafQ of YafQ-DinJ toxin-antitoxin module